MQNLLYVAIKVTRPSQLFPLQTRAASTGNKRKYDDLTNAVSTIGDISDAEIAQWVPDNSTEIIYWNEPVFDNPGSLELHPSHPFRSGMKICLEGTCSQPSDIFDPLGVQV